MHSVTSNAVAEEIADIGIETFSYTRTSGLSYALQCVKFGKIRIISGHINGSNIANGGVIFKLNSGDFFSGTRYYNAVCESTTAKYPCVIGLANGEVKVYHNGSNVGGIFLSIIFSIS